MTVTASHSRTVPRLASDQARMPTVSGKENPSATGAPMTVPSAISAAQVSAPATGATRRNSTVAAEPRVSGAPQDTEEPSKTYQSTKSTPATAATAPATA